ncbi:T9SS type A sorting domain-containing protein [Robertkochia solimangrovi]|uniref:T9SS type A sorting domain-containing protein n=1 Tax=Robertkochia solimangrovi TaxID=2213046 RepID=UPI00117DF40C|nr:T9SS type A sorting domain-containing protein [Robertkochia solimangrovi]TRZ42794.1 hypothetical protein DMZ48_12035 [Robertkochia solimangrovi]
MKIKTTLFFCLLILQNVLSAPTELRKDNEQTTQNTAIPFTDMEAPVWSMDYSILAYNQSWQHEEDVKVFPNPVNRKDALNVTLKGTGKKSLNFYDITGKLVKQLTTERNEIAISIAELGVGVYILNVKSDSIQTTKKVIIR